MSKEKIDPERIQYFRNLLEQPFNDLIIQLCQIGYGEGALNCIMKDNQLAFTEVSRKKNTMFEIKRHD